MHRHSYSRRRIGAGPHTLIVGELVSAKGKRLTDSFVLPFFVSDSRAKVSSSMRVESIVRLQIERLGTVRVSSSKRPEGRYIEIMKVVDRKSGRHRSSSHSITAASASTQKMSLLPRSGASARENLASFTLR